MLVLEPTADCPGFLFTGVLYKPRDARECIVMETGVVNPRIQGLENYCMHPTDRFIRSLFLAAAIVTPALVVAEAQQASVQVRVYDGDHRDYHKWDDHEDHAYRRYLAEEHRSYREYHRQYTKCRGTIGIGATVIRTAISEGTPIAPQIARMRTEVHLCLCVRWTTRCKYFVNRACRIAR